MWTDFRMQEMDPRTMEIIFGRIGLLQCEFFMYYNGKTTRIGRKVKNSI